MNKNQFNVADFLSFETDIAIIVISFAWNLLYEKDKSLKLFFQKLFKGALKKGYNKLDWHRAYVNVNLPDEIS
jgi:hypothetical protein